MTTTPLNNLTASENTENNSQHNSKLPSFTSLPTTLENKKLSMPETITAKLEMTDNLTTIRKVLEQKSSKPANNKNTILTQIQSPTIAKGSQSRAQSTSHGSPFQTALPADMSQPLDTNGLQNGLTRIGSGGALPRQPHLLSLSGSQSNSQNLAVSKPR